MTRCLACVLLAPFIAQADDAAQLLESKLMSRLRALDERVSGVLGAAAIDLTGKRTLSYNGSTVFPQASSIKIPILAALLEAMAEGRMKPDDPAVLEPKDAAGGSGHLQIRLRHGPITLTLRELAEAMIETSDNTATNRIIALAGMERVNRRMEQLGLGQTKLRRIMMDSAAAARGDENVSTPLEMARLMELIYRGQLINPEASKEMLRILKLPRSDFRRAVRGSIEVAAKAGELDGVRCETGLILVKNRPFALSVMSTFLAHGENPVPEAAKLFFDYFDALGRSNAFGHKLQ